jgi:recombination protein RecT
MSLQHSKNPEELTIKGRITMAKAANTNDLQNAITKKENNLAPAEKKRELAFKTLNNMFTKSANELKKVLPPDQSPERIARVTLTACRKNPALLDCNLHSLIGAVFQSAQLGLEPDLLGSAYLVPYKDQVQLLIGYKGYIDLIYRSPRVITVQAHEVREGDHFRMRLGSDPYLEHEPAQGKQGEILGYYAIVQLTNNGCMWHYMTKKQVEEYRDQHSTDYKYKKSKGYENNSVWGKHFDSMAKKTVLRQLTTWLPMSVQEKQFQAIDETVTKDLESEPEYIDVEVSEENAAE